MSPSEFPPAVYDAVVGEIGRRSGRSFHPSRAREIGGGCIHGAYVLESPALRVFVKVNASACAAMFAAEAAALAALGGAGALRVPAPLATGVAGAHAWLALEFLALDERRQDWARFGRGLAALHRCRGEHYGWPHDNYIGTTPQPNGWMDNWPRFVRECRLGHQLALAAASGYGGRLQSAGARLLDGLDVFFRGYQPSPSLLHGDLWSGNAGFLAEGEPVIFDPAAYYGDREAELAMTELFGGFPPAFYAAYEEAWATDAGYTVRRRLYRLYHLLNHLNLFGAGYLDRCQREIDSLLGELA